MRLHSAVIASATSLALTLALPATALAGQGAPEEGELVLDEDGVVEEEPAAEDSGPSEEERMEAAKALYLEAKGEAEKGNWEAAMNKYEEAYILVPSKHGFAHKVGMAAYNAGNCDKTVQYLVHFIHYTDHEKHGDQVEEARTVLAEMLDKGCTTEVDIHYYHLSNEERSGMARDLYIEAEGLAEAGDWKAAEAKYEEAYILVPHKIGFSHKVGVAAYNAWSDAKDQIDCDKAHQYLIHFVDFADPEKYADKISESETMLGELETCVSSEEAESHQVDSDEVEAAFDDDNPFENGTGGTDKGPKSKGKKGLLIGGAVLTVVGLAGVGVGAAGFVLASNSVKELNDLASLETPTGYPLGDYSDAKPVEQLLGTQRLVGYLGVGVGGAALVTGIALIAVHASKNKKKGSASARLESIAPTFTRDSVGASALVRF